MRLRVIAAIVAAFSLLSPSLAMADAPALSNTGTVAVAGDVLTLQPLNGQSSVAIEVSGTFSGSLQPQIVLTSNWANVQVVNATSGVIGSAITAPGIYIANVASANAFRLLGAAGYSGSATVTVRATGSVIGRATPGFGSGGGSASSVTAGPGVAVSQPSPGVYQVTNTGVRSLGTGSNIINTGTANDPIVATTDAPTFPGATTLGTLKVNNLATQRCAQPDATGIFQSSGYACGAGQDMWVTSGNPNNAIYRIDGQKNVKTYNVPGYPTLGFVGGDGSFYYSDNAAVQSFHSISINGAITDYTSPGASNAVLSFTLDPMQRVWYTQDGNPGAFGVVNANGTTTSYPVANGDQLFGITLGPDGNMWGTLYGAAGVAKVNPNTGVVTRYPNIFPAGSNPRGIVAGLDGYLYVTGQTSNAVYRVTTLGVVLYSAPLPTANSQPYGIIMGPDGNVWFGENNNAKMGKLVPSTATITEYTTAANTIFPSVGPDGNIWFTQTNNTVGEIGVNGLYYSTVALANPAYGITYGYGAPIYSTLRSADGNLLISDGSSKAISLSTAIKLSGSLSLTALTAARCLQTGTGGTLTVTANACATKSYVDFGVGAIATTQTAGNVSPSAYVTSNGSPSITSFNVSCATADNGNSVFRLYNGTSTLLATITLASGALSGSTTFGPLTVSNANNGYFYSNVQTAGSATGCSFNITGTRTLQ